MKNRELTANERIDIAVESMLRAGGNPKLACYMPSTQMALRDAMRSIMSQAYIDGSRNCEAAIEYAYGHAPSNAGIKPRREAASA